MSTKSLVFAGAVRHTDGLAYAYLLVKPDGTLADEAQLFAQPLGDYPPGARCKFRMSQSGDTVLPQGAEYEGTWPDKAAVAEWAARHGAVLASEAAWVPSELPRPFEALAPIREAYGRLDEERQGVLLAQVVRYIVTPP